ncbi:S8 family serine peptidase (plasmid) [Deinococcus taeanensis]|uniref:S8 family peptidase n=1 Tax=Deinococcus taeanensis TaxID=2737050 RepID=UPI001CDD4486|nr:S8 family serine peptidase [Deinococcus taeanensis]UBV45451.1 S8 family serine peptidase [Deinococcus taeanensis]
MNRRTAALLGLTVALVACGTAPHATPTTLTTQGGANSAVLMKTAESSGSFGAWATKSYGAWASGSYGAWASTTPDGRLNTFSDNVDDWNAIHLSEGQAVASAASAGGLLGNGIVVAVIDTGIETGHPAFAGKLTDPATWYDFVSNDSTPDDLAGGAASGHGTAVAGLVLQVAPDAMILPIRALNADGAGYSTTLARAVDFAVSKGARIINISAVADVDSTLTTAIGNATAKGVYVTLPAGNNAQNNVSYPGRNSVQNNTLGQYAVNTGAINADYTLTSFTNYGNQLELLAPGQWLSTACPGGTVCGVKGTSFSSPIIAGALALGLGMQYNPAYVGKLGLQMNTTAMNVFPYNKTATGGQPALGNGALDVQAWLNSIK